MKQQIKTLDIKAKEWFDKVNGNSYFSAQVTINFGLGDQKIINIPFQYGYGNMYLQLTRDQLQIEDYLPPETIPNITSFCRENNIILRYDKKEKCTKAEVKAFTNYR